MKFFGNGRRRLLSLVLSLVLVVGLMPAIYLPGYAASFSTMTACNYEYYSPSGCLKSIDVTIQAVPDSYALAYGKIAVHTAETSYGWYNKYTGSGSVWPSPINDPTLLALDTNEFQWTDCQLHTVTVSFSDNMVKMEPGTTYYVYLWTRSPTFGIYPDAFIGSFTADQSGKVVFTSSGNQVSPPVSPHTHIWNSLTSGLGTKKASTTISCKDMACGEAVEVSLTASDVTLPGDVFSAEISVEKIERPAVAFALRTARQAPAGLPEGLPEGLTISEPVYKYSATGSGYEPIDPASFTPKAGYYQAAVQITDDYNNNSTVAELAVKYTVSDPAVTAATGDNRPIELMIMGMAFFCAMAAAAFVLDGRRKAR